MVNAFSFEIFQTVVSLIFFMYKNLKRSACSFYIVRRTNAETEFSVGQRCLFLTNSKCNAKAVIQQIKQEKYKCEHCSFPGFHSAGFPSCSGL